MTTNFTEIQSEIEKNYLYYIDYLKKHLSQEKINHCISTAVYALFIKRTNPIQLLEEKVILSGLLHDICREWDSEELMKKAEDFGIKITPYERRYPVLLHGPVSAHYIMNEFNIHDNDIFEAIYWHTTGKANWGITGQILYVADFSEPLRKYSQAEKTRNILLQQGFYEALLYSANERYLLSLKKRDPSPYSLEFINWLKEKKGVFVNAE